MNMDDEWDLHAVVRSCTTTIGAAENATAVDGYDDVFHDLEGLACGNESNPFAFSTPVNVSGGLEDVYKAGCGQLSWTAGETASTAAIAVEIDAERFGHEQLPTLTDSHSFSMSTQSTRSRKRKSQEKRVFKLTQEQLSNDLWAWRKYGQKPIKGSPYPRNYYRCSTTKACGAKKQVERSLMDSNIFIVSYCGEHIHPLPTHRSSLAGTTRSNKFNNNTTIAPCSSSSPVSTSSFSSTTSLKEEEYEINDEEYEEDVNILDVSMNEDVLNKFQNLNSNQV